MNRLALARHGYEPLAAALRHSLDERISDQADRWLKDEVCPVAEELARDATFRRQVRWSLDHLCRGAASGERRLVESVDAALVDCAGQLSGVMNPCGGGQAADVREQEFLLKLSPVDCSAVKLIASRPWFDLVCAEDLLHPWQDLFLVSPNWGHTQAFRQRGELRIPLGDYVARMMLARVDYWKTLLDCVFNKVYAGTYGSSPSLEQAREGLFSAKLQLDQASERLKQACAPKEGQAREACLTLVQVYAAYALNANLDWLVLPTSWQARGGSIRSCIRRRGEIVIAEQRNGRLVVAAREPASLCDPMVLRQIAAALEDVVSLYETPEDDGKRLQWALDRARLVMVDEAPRIAYWNRQAVAEGAWDDHPREWDLLWTLARHRGRVVDQRKLANPEKHDIRSRRYRLGGLLAAALELDSLIETRRGQGYLLNLAADEVILLGREEQGRLEFLQAAARA